jgi:hypothetical protein
MTLNPFGPAPNAAPDEEDRMRQALGLGDVPIAVEIGEAGVTGLRTYAASAVGSRAG